MPRHSVFLALTFAAASAAHAQEITVFATSTKPGPWRQLETVSARGVSIAGFQQVPRPSTDTIKAKQSLGVFGLRFSVSDVHASMESTACVNCDFDRQELVVGSSTISVKIRTAQYIVLWLPIRTESARIELGGGGVQHTMRGDMSAKAQGWVGTAAFSGRLTSRLPLWITVGYDLYATDDPEWPSDGSSARIPKKAARLGLFLWH